MHISKFLETAIISYGLKGVQLLNQITRNGLTSVFRAIFLRDERGAHGCVNVDSHSCTNGDYEEGSSHGCVYGGSRQRVEAGQHTRTVAVGSNYAMVVPLVLTPQLFLFEA